MMTDDDIEVLKRRFGDDPAAWPAPYRQLARPELDEFPLDRLVRDAATDDREPLRLAQSVIDRIGADQRATPRPDWFSFSPRLAMIAAAALLVAAALGGDRFAGLVGAGGQGSLFALATGDPADLLPDIDVNSQEEEL